MTLAVIGAALPRTGTLSLKFALERLGLGPCYHMTELITHPEDAGRWSTARFLPRRLDTLWQRYRSTVDFPGCGVWRQLARRFPQAKVVLTRRDPERWYESLMETVGGDKIKPLLHSPVGLPMLTLNPLGLSQRKDKMIARFENYGEDVHRTIPLERLLVFEASEGWEPLCAFLGVEAPDTPYPRANDRATMQATAGRHNVAQLTFPEIQQHVRQYLESERQRFIAR